MAVENKKEDWLSGQIEKRRIQIIMLQKEIDKLNEELDIITEIKSSKLKIEKLEEEITKLEAQFDSTDWQQAYEEACLDAYWHAASVAKKHLKEERYLQEQIDEKREEIVKLKQKISSLEEKQQKKYKIHFSPDEQGTTASRKK